MRLLHHLVLSQDGLKSLSAHLSERPFGRDYLVTGVGRIACTEVPDWISSHALGSQLDQLASESAILPPSTRFDRFSADLGFELLEDVLSPDEVDDVSTPSQFKHQSETEKVTQLYSLCRDEDEDEEDLARQEATDRIEEEEMAAQNIDAMES